MKKEEVCREFPVGTTVVCDRMIDPQPIPTGMKGVVMGIDDAAQIHVRWENGSGLALIPGTDVFHKE